MNASHQYPLAAQPPRGCGRSASVTLEFVQNSINGLQTANFILHCVKKPRHTFQVCLRFLPCSEQNFLVFASSSKFEQTLNVFVTVSSNLFEHLLKGLNENEPCSSPQICVNKNWKSDYRRVPDSLTGKEDAAFYIGCKDDST